MPTSDQTPKAPPGPAAGRPRPSGVDADGSRWVWPFKLKERIGEGGMGVVYRGEYAVNGREVAVKMLPGDVTDEVVLKRFEQELEILKELKHPNIVRCFGGVCENENRFYAMELVEGGSLEEELDRRGSFPWEQAVAYGREMAAALQASHEKGIVHRDVKPGNFLKTKAGRLKLSDFGLARIDAGRKITRAGKTAGTVLYMAPEQIRGKEITPAADLYALGCVLYEMISGRTPFEGESSAAILHAHVLNAPPRLASLATDCPPVLEELVHQLLEKEPADRPASAAEVGDRLDTLSQTAGVTRASSTGSGRISSVPVSAPATPDSETQTLTTPRVRSAGPTWLVPSLAAGAVVAALAAAWLGSQLSAAGAWRDELLRLSTDSAVDTRVVAVAAVARLGEGDADALEAVLRGLGDANAMVRAAAAKASPDLNSGDMTLLGTLQRLAREDDDDAVRREATTAVSRIKDR